jgi:histidinol dehydrogenase
MIVRIAQLARLSRAERARILDRRPSRDPRAAAAAARIVDEVARGGDAALRRLTRRFDGVSIDRLEVGLGGRVELSIAARRAIDEMWRRVEAFHRQGIPGGFVRGGGGVMVGRAAVPFRVAGIYVPGGRAAYPSTVVMAAVPARVAGVERVVVCTPPDRRGRVPDAVLYAARRAGVDRLFRVGGAQAIAAMAYGTATIPRADIVVGPGNVYVNAAKEIVSARCAIDFVAGPTEVLIVSDGSAPARFLAFDMAAQAEHDPEARAILVTTSRAQAEGVAAELERIVATEVRARIIRASLRRYGRILLCRGLEEAFAFSNEYAPEHLEIATRDPARRLREVRSAGSVFLGPYSGCAFGDYGAGPNHILPTAGAAARTGALSAMTFLKFIPYQAATAAGARRLAGFATRLAALEGLDCHRRSMEVRVDGNR